MQRLIVFVLLSLPLLATAQTLRYVGTAYVPDTRQPVYTETYTEQFNSEGKLTSSAVVYEQHNGNPLAEKFLDYARHPYAPAFQFHNRKTGYRESMSWLADGRVRLSHQEADAKAKDAIIRVPEPAVADAGFNQFMRDHLTRLQNGEVLEFHFLNPARLTWYRFTAQRTARTQDTLTITIAPANTVLRWLVQPIELVYSAQDARLLHYRGLTNISLQGSNTISAHIDYHYPEPDTSTLSRIREALEYWLETSEG